MKGEWYMKRNKTGGFGLVEVLIALLLFTIGILAISNIFPLSVKNVETSQDLLIASEILTGTIELLNQPSNPVQTALASNAIMNTFQPIRELANHVVPNVAGYDDPGNPLIPRYQNFERQILVNRMPEDPEYGPRVRVVVTVRWTDTTGRQRTMSMPAVIDLNKSVYLGV